jgi:beta-mannosidase
LVLGGQWLQCEGYKVLFEEARRQKPRSAMALNWCFNEPWPSAANNSLVNWPAEPKPAYYAVAAACRPVMASAKIPKFQWIVGEAFEAELWRFNDSPESLPAGRITASIVVAGVEIQILEWLAPASPAQQHLRGPMARAVVPDGAGADRFVFRLTYHGEPARGSEYTMPLRGAPVRPPSRAAAR